jgi:hypothetical protein
VYGPREGQGRRRQQQLVAAVVRVGSAALWPQMTGVQLIGTCPFYVFPLFLNDKGEKRERNPLNNLFSKIS